MISPLRASSRSDRPRPTTRPTTTLRPSGPAGGDVQAFPDDDAGYRAWVGAHPTGFVLNAVRPDAARPGVLHRVGCASLRTANTSTTRTMKVCAPSASDLEAWSVKRGAVAPLACRRCGP